MGCHDPPRVLTGEAEPSWRVPRGVWLGPPGPRSAGAVKKVNVQIQRPPGSPSGTLWPGPRARGYTASAEEARSKGQWRVPGPGGLSGAGRPTEALAPLDNRASAVAQAPAGHHHEAA